MTQWFCLGLKWSMRHSTTTTETKKELQGNKTTEAKEWVLRCICPRPWRCLLWSVTTCVSPLGSTQAATSPLAIVHGQSSKEPARVLRPAGRHQHPACCVFSVRVSVCVLCVRVSLCVTPCDNSKRKGANIQNVPMYVGKTRICVSTCARGAGTHGYVLNGHTESRGHSPDRTSHSSSRKQAQNEHFLSILTRCWVHASSPIFCLP